MFFNIKFHLVILIIIYLALVPLSKLKADSYTKETLSRLERGKVIVNYIEISDNNDLEAAEARILIHATPEKVWYILENQERMDEIISNIRDIKVLKKDFSFQKVRVNIETVPLMPIFEYTVLLEASELYKEMKFKRIEGSFDDLYGVWRIEPYKDGTILTYIMYIDFGFYLPDFVRSFGLKKMLPGILKSIKEEAESQNKESPVKVNNGDA